MPTTASDHSVAVNGDVYGDVSITHIENHDGTPPYTPPPPPAPEELPDPGSLPPGSRLPLSRNADFTGRESYLLALGRALLTDAPGPTLITQAIQGLGGVGKTQLAAEFAYRYGRFFHSVHWLKAAQPSTIPAEIAACGAAMDLPAWPDELPKQVARTLRVWGDGHPRLLLLDNLENVAAAREWLGKLNVGRLRILLTARRANWPTDLTLSPLPLPPFTPEESVAYLRRHLDAKRATRADLLRLAKRLGHLPLALFLAGRYLTRLPSLRVADYLTRLEQVFTHRSMRGWQSEMGNPTGHDLDLRATFALSWEQVQDETARRVFVLAATCAPNEPLPRSLLTKAAEIEPEECDLALDTLLGLGLLLPPSEGEQEPSIHPLLAEYGQGREQDAQATLTALADALKSLSYAANETGLPSNAALLIPHLQKIAEDAERAELEQAGALWNNLGAYLHDVAELAGAKDAYERALAIFERVLGAEHPNVATLVNNLGSVLKDLGDLAGAKAAYERALAIDEHVYGPVHPSVARDVNNLGNVLRDLGDLAGAKVAFEWALAIFKRVLGAEHPNVATLVNNLGGVLQELGDLARAKAAYERALAIDEHVYGPDHPNVATRVNNLGSVLQDLGDLAGAKAAFERVLDILDKTLPPEHPYVAATTNNLGSVLQDLGDLAGAKAAFERALAIDERVYGPDHPSVATCVNNLGGVLYNLGDLARAKAAYERALAIWEAVLGPEHPNVASAVNNLGSVLQDLGDLEGAKAAFERALAIFEKFLPPEHRYIKLVRNNLASVKNESHH